MQMQPTTRQTSANMNICDNNKHMQHARHMSMTTADATTPIPMQTRAYACYSNNKHANSNNRHANGNKKRAANKHDNNKCK